MALFHLSVTQTKRSAGQSAIASAAYRAGERLYSEYYGEYSDYTRKGGVICSDILLPSHAPPEYADRQTLWNAVEKAERGKNAQLAYSFDIALQNEFSLEENIALARQFLLENFVSRGMVVDFAVHQPDREDGGIPNPHFHVLCPIRPIEQNGKWGLKQRLVDEQRTQTAQAAPKAEELLALTEENQPQRKASGKANHGIILPGNEDMDIPVRFGKCCSPVPGDDIVGFITRGRGVTIHKADCVNVLRGEAERRVQVAWADGDTGTGFCVSIKIVAYDHTNLLIELATIIGDANVPIKTVNTELDEKNRIATFRFVLEVKSREQMDKLVKLLQRKTDVIDVFRVQG